MPSEFPLTTIFLRLVLSLFLGFIIGFEREVMHKPAGLRTNMLVALGSCGFTMLTFELFHTFNAGVPTPLGDPIRIINGIMEGLGFLAAGSIIQSRGSVEGVTTAATIWVVGAVGLSCGVGNYYLAVGITVLAYIVLTVLRIVESRFLGKNTGK
jgi:putative Mg2+ transporter-C (MgtC) family protein